MAKPLYGLVVSIAISSVFGSAAMASDDPPSGQQSLEEVIPITMANLRGQKALYEEGWFVISSTERAFQYAQEKFITSSGQALQQMQASLGERSEQLPDALAEGINEGVESGKSFYQKGGQRSDDIYRGTHEVAQQQLNYAKQGFVKAWDRFVLGNITLVKRTEEDRQALMAIPGDYYHTLKSDFSNLYQLSQTAADAITPEIELNWSASLQQAQASFAEEYEASGEAANSLSGLGDILAGYAKAAYHAIFKPSGQAIAKGATATVGLAGQALFLPTASLFVVTGRTVQSAGLSLYYTTKTGYKLVSPTLEGGMLGGVSLLAGATAPVTYGAGMSAGMLNQVAVTTLSPVVGGATAVGSTLAETAEYAGLVTYDLAKGGSKVVINQISSGVVLGYNALTALPTQALLSTANGAFFLVYDGPRLMVAKVSGRLSDEGEAQTIDSLPVGTVVDMKQLEQVPELMIEPVSDDPALIEQVLENMAEDLRQ